jgi:hypothetical protein
MLLTCLLGDNAEITSIARVFTKEGNRDTELYVGSVKSNIGHLEATSRIAGLMKAVLILKHGMIPLSLDFETPRKNLRLDERKIKILTELTPLPVRGTPRVSVNSFGYGGTNAHIILDAAPKELQNGHSSGHSNLEAESTNGTTTNGTNGVNGINGTDGHAVNGINGVNGTNGHAVNGTNGHATNGTNGVTKENGVGHNSSSHSPSSNRPTLLPIQFSLLCRKHHPRLVYRVLLSVWTWFECCTFRRQGPSLRSCSRYLYPYFRIFNVE